jgi:hypothetical protein
MILPQALLVMLRPFLIPSGCMLGRYFYSFRTGDLFALGKTTQHSAEYIAAAARGKDDVQWSSERL